MNSLPKDAAAPVSEIELSQVDLRFEGYRLRQPGLEGKLLASMAQRGLQEPLQGVVPGYVLLNGFKRYRCAQKLHIHTVAFAPLGTDEVSGIVNLLRTPDQNTLSLLEQARFVDELRAERGMSVAEIAQELSRSKGWVSMRVGLMAGMSPLVRDKLFAGVFPIYAYMYTCARSCA